MGSGDHPGSEEAFAAFVAGCYPRMVRLGSLLLAGDPEGEDLVQVALVRLARHWHRVEEPEAYLRRTIVNLAADHGRYHRRRPLLLLPPEEMPDNPGSSELGGAQDLAPFGALLRQLPLRQRQVLVLRYGLDLGESETAGVLGCSVGAVKSHTFRALHRLRAELTTAAPVAEATAPA